ncbi:F0F1 ATP synthase subunit gamma [Rhodanobacter terrae]|uniref:F0F1 ATP synthase subunit gamma n=1 Tax=Rhodanobacter terrae TaxID=418647 RepID=A0ABW0T0P1_9GAMM
MSDSLANLRRKIGSAAELQSVVRTMKALAASSIGQYEQSVLSLSDYYRTVELALGVCFRQAAAASALPPEAREHAASGIVVFGSDQGLVGQFNDKVTEHALETLAELAGNTLVWAVGERVHARLTDAGITPVGLFGLPGSVQAITPLVWNILVHSERQQSLSALHLCYNQPLAGAGFAPVSQRLLPLDDAWRRRLADRAWPTRNLPEVIGNRSTTLRALIREYLFVSIFRACAESLAAENASRLAAMQRAEKNIDSLLETLNGSFHRLRQDSIDEELFDVITGFEALSKTPRGRR